MILPATRYQAPRDNRLTHVLVVVPSTAGDDPAAPTTVKFHPATCIRVLCCNESVLCLAKNRQNHDWIGML
jgi:hypothetical protein